MGKLQLALDIRDKAIINQARLRDLALLRIVVPDPSLYEQARKIVSGIGIPDSACTPLRVALGNEALPSEFVQVTNMVIRYIVSHYRRSF